MENVAVIKDQPFEADIKTSSGHRSKRKFRVRTIGIKREFIDKISKQETSEGSRADPLEKLYTTGRIIPPPYNLNELATLVERSNILQECLDAICVNVGGFGYMFRPRSIQDDLKKQFEIDIESERINLQLYWESICSDYSFIEARKRMRRDLESVGNGYFELIESVNGDSIVEINHIQGHSIRLGRVSDTPQEYNLFRVNPQRNFKVEAIRRKKRFRNFVQVDQSGKKLVWFKEWRDPRKMSKTTGKYEHEGDSIDASDEASALYHFKIYSSKSPYGIPRFVGRYPAIEGSRRSEEINYFTMGNNLVPSAFLSVEDGEFTDGTIERLTELVETQIGEDLNYSKFMILEAESTLEDPMPGQSGKARIRIDPMASIQPKDQMFQDYDRNNQDKIRRAWRLPPLFLGMAEEYTRATADASRRVGDEQVFAPEREAVDWFANQLQMSMGARFHIFKTKTPNITDNIELIKAMGIAEKSGGMTPRRANVLMEDIFDGTLGPLPEKVDPDIPYSLQFAWAQTAGKIAQVGNEDDNKDINRSVRIDWDWAEEYIANITRDV